MSRSSTPAPQTTEVRQIGVATRRHYDRYSYNFETALHAPMQLDGTLLGRALAALRAGAAVVDAGCGTGLVSRLVRDIAPGARVVGVDLSLGSLRRAQQRSAIALAQGNILELPVRSDAVDLTISRGVIMTTGAPRAAFSELVRITRPGGHFFLRVYNRRHPYAYLYRFLGPPCRAIAAVPGGKTLLAVLALPPFVLAVELACLLVAGRPARFSPRLAWNLFADQFLTPHNSFHTVDEILAWGAAEGCRGLAHQAITLGQQIEFLFEKGTP
jgi:SAM-dependent methyltransferase